MMKQQKMKELIFIMKKLIGKLIAMSAGLLFSCLFMSATVQAAQPQTENVEGHVVTLIQTAVVTTAQADVRSAPSASAQVIGKVQKEQAVNVCGQTDNGWYQVVYGNGIGYISNQQAVQIPVDDATLAALAAQTAWVKQNAAQGAALEQQAQAAALAQQQAQEAAALAQQQAQEAAALAQQQAQAAALAASQAALQAAPGSGNVIFVGDSRTGQMGNAVGGSAAYPGVAFVSCYGGGNEWLSTTKAKADIDQFVTPGSIIIINYGVNDLAKHNEYIATINKYNQDWRSKGATVYFATVGPVGENEYGKRNWAVEYFNDQLSNRLDGSIGRIPLYQYLVLTGYTPTADGLHYTPDTYVRMFQYLMQSVGK